MLRYRVEGMTCGHCVQTVTKAVMDLDAGADVRIDLASKSVEVRTTAPSEDVARAIEAAGYAPRLAA